MPRTESKPDYLLWILFTLTFAAGGALGQRALIPGNNMLECWSRIARGDRSGLALLIAVATAVFLVAAAAAAGWFTTRLANWYGVRLTGRPASSLAADYDDAQQSPTPPKVNRTWPRWVETTVMVALCVAALICFAAIVMWRVKVLRI